MDRLTPISPGVVHSSAFRTRLKAAKWQDASADDVALVKDALERVPGVTEVRPMLRGFVIEHESRPDVVENIGVALAEVSPVLLEDLTKHSKKDKKSGHKLLDRFRLEWPQFDFAMPNMDACSLSDAGPMIKKAVPAILAGAGAVMLLEGEALLAGLGPLALFYVAYDYHWKMKQEEEARGEVTAEHHA
jgi:hypothetical protein